MTNVKPRDVYDCTMNQRNMVRAHLERVRENVNRYQKYSWDRAMQELNLAKWEAISAVLEALCEGKTVQPS